MRDPARINRIIEKLRAYWHAHPDQRLGQLIVNLATRSHQKPFYVEDDVIEPHLDLWSKETPPT